MADGARTVAEVEATGGEALAVRCDVSDPAQVEAAVAVRARFGGLDVLVNDAGSPAGLAHEGPRSTCGRACSR